MKNINTRNLHKKLTFLMAILILLPHSLVVAKGKKVSYKPLGPTGLAGTEAKDWIRIGKVAKGSPADGKISVGDIIIRVGGKKLSRVTRWRPWAIAIDEAESMAGKGKLELEIKGGKKVTLQLQVLGSYSATAPYNCSKSDKIITQIADSLLPKPKSRKNTQIGEMKSGILGLMATGEKKYREVAFDMIKNSKFSKMDLKTVENILDGTTACPGNAGWGWGYSLVTLGEYYLLTKDKSVLPAMKAYAIGLARGQDPAGMWGHRLATKKYRYRIPGYGAMNQPSITNLMGMIYAKKCGIDDPDLDKAIQKTSSYISSFSNRAAFGYGTGSASPGFNNNGTSGSAAIVMMLRGNDKGTSYFSKLCATSFNNLEQGHASSFFNPLWTPMGTNLSGPEVTHQFFKRTMWFHNMRRLWDGGYAGSGKEGPEAGYALLTYCLPRKALLITGREMKESLWLKGEDATDTVMMSLWDYDKKSHQELISLLEHPIPQVGHLAAQALQKRSPETIAPLIMKTIKSTTVSEGAKQRAIAYFRANKKGVLNKYVDTIGSIVRDKKQPLRVRSTAAVALGFGRYEKAAYPYYSDMLSLLLEKMPEDDLTNSTEQNISFGVARLCSQPLKTDGIVVDKVTLYKVARNLIDSKNQSVRGIGVSMLVGIPAEDFHLVADKLAYVMDDKDRTYHTYGNAFKVMQPGITILAALNVKEGIDYMLDLVFGGYGGKWAFKIRVLFETLPLYGANVKPYISKFEEHPNINKKGDRFAPPWQKMVKEIREDKNPKKLITLKEVIEAGMTSKK